jgi:hypothetical protein
MVLNDGVANTLVSTTVSRGGSSCRTSAVTGSGRPPFPLWGIPDAVVTKGLSSSMAADLQAICDGTRVSGACGYQFRGRTKYPFLILLCRCSQVALGLLAWSRPIQVIRRLLSSTPKRTSGWAGLGSVGSFPHPVNGGRGRVGVGSGYEIHLRRTKQ